MRVTINHENYSSESHTFESVEAAQAAIRDCGPDFSGVTLEQSGDRVLNERGEIVGHCDE